MRMHMQLPDDLVAELDSRIGPRQRSAFIAELIRRSLDDQQRWDELESAIGSIPDAGHEWDADPAEWIRSQRHDVKRAG